MNYVVQTRTPEELALLLATDEYQETITSSPFLYLTLDLPVVPLFSVSHTHTHTHTQHKQTHTHITQDELERNIIPQVPLFDLLSKFDGTKEKVQFTL